MTTDATVPSPAIRTRGLAKRYGPIQALDHVDLELPVGSVTLLAGPNGAGKSTLIRVLMDLVSREAGTVRVLGMDPARRGRAVRASIGLLPEELDFPFDVLKVREVLDFHATYRPTWDPEYADRLRDTLELPMDRRWKQLSKGQRRRVQFTAALAHRPPLLLLDEPTDGLDPVGRETVLGLIAEHLAETGTTVLYCTHVLSEGQGLADHLVVLGGGRVLVSDSVRGLRDTLFRVELKEPGEPTIGESVEVVRREPSTPGTEHWTLRGNSDAIRRWATEHSLEILSLDPLSPAEAALAYLAGRRPRPQGSASARDSGGSA